MGRYCWNPWHGCRKISAGCKNCWLFYLDARRERDAGVVSRSKTLFDLPLRKDRAGNYKIPPGQLATCFTSDFFIEEADEWRDEAWAIMRRRPDVEFFIPTKRISRLRACLPADWGDGYDNVFIVVSIENQAAADARLPFLVDAPVKKKGVLAAPLLEKTDLSAYLASGCIRYVSVGGESYANARVCDFEWVESIKRQCDNYGVEFDFHQTGSLFRLDGKTYTIPHRKEYAQAKKAFPRK